MIELGRIFLPLMLDYSSEKGTITFRSPEYGTTDYIENSECSLHLAFSNETVFIDYYCEDDIYLSEVFGLSSIASGNLDEEDFASIQSQAMQVLFKYLDDSQNEILEHFDKI